MWEGERGWSGEESRRRDGERVAAAVDWRRRAMCIVKTRPRLRGVATDRFDDILTHSVS